MSDIAWQDYHNICDENERLRAENERLTDRCVAYKGQIFAGERRITALEGERDTATRALAVLDKIAWLAAEEDGWFGDETDITVQRAAAERHRAALSKTEGKDRWECK